MKEFKVSWTKYPTNYNSTHVLFIEAETPEDARAIAIDHIERRYGVPKREFMIGYYPRLGSDPLHGIEEVTTKAPAGRVKGEA